MRDIRLPLFAFEATVLVPKTLDLFPQFPIIRLQVFNQVQQPHHALAGLFYIPDGMEINFF